MKTIALVLIGCIIGSTATVVYEQHSQACVNTCYRAANAAIERAVTQPVDLKKVFPGVQDQKWVPTPPSKPGPEPQITPKSR